MRKWNLWLLSSLLGLAAAAQEGTGDPTFNASGTGANNPVNVLVRESSGKLLVGGSFSTYNGVGRSRVARLNADGSLDASFTPGAGADDKVSAIAVQADGKILVGGAFFNFNNSYKPRLVRLNTDGTLDATFNAGTPGNAVAALAVQPDGKILVGGYFQSYNGTNAHGLVRLNADGSLDATFQGSASGTASVTAIALQPDGKIIAGGTFENYNGSGRNGLVRLHANGSLDTDFYSYYDVQYVHAIALRSNGQMFVGGEIAGHVYGVNPSNLVLLNPNGTIDGSFNTANTFSQNSGRGVWDLKPLADGRVLVAGKMYEPSRGETQVARLLADGSIDPNFTLVNAGGTAYDLAVQPDGKVLAVGSLLYPGVSSKNVLRINSAAPTANTIATGAVTLPVRCPGTTFSVPYTAAGTYGGANVFSVQLSDAYGSFASPVVIGSLAATGSGSINATLPANTAGGYDYRVRVVSSSPAVTGINNGSDLEVNSTYFFNVHIDASADTLCPGSGVSFTSTVEGGLLQRETATKNGFQWYRDNVAIPGAGGPSYTDAAPVNGSVYKLVMTPTASSSICYATPTYTSNLVTITVQGATASIAYGGSPYALGAGTAAVTNSGSTGGTFSSTTGLALDATTGAIDLSASQPGTYTVTYTVSTPCGLASGTAQVTLVASFSASIAYPGSPYCAATGTVPVVRTGSTGGTYSAAPAGLSLDAATGTIDLAASLPGTYTVRYGVSASSFTTTQVSVRPTPYIDPLPNLVVCDGTQVPAINVSGGAGQTYSWSNSDASIGLAATGSGNLPAFTARNGGSAPLVSTVTVTAAGGTGCELQPRNMVFRITVKPSPSLVTPADQVLCAGTASAPVTFSSSLPGTTVLWKNSNAAIGLGAVGTGNIPSFVGMDQNASIQYAVVTATPHVNGCAGSPVRFNLTVSPAAGTIAYSRASFCPSGYAVPTRTGSLGGMFSAAPSGLHINATTGQVNLALSEPGDYHVFYTIVSLGTCGSTAITQLTVLPQATVNPVPNQVYCNNVNTLPVYFTGSGNSYTWTNDNLSVGLEGSGSGPIRAFAAVNNTGSTQTATIRVTPQGGSSSCPGKTVVFRYIINACTTPVVRSAQGIDGTAVTLSPVPAAGQLSVSLDAPASGTYTAQVLSAAGTAATSPTTFAGTRTVLNVAALTPGYYVLQLVNTRTKEVTRKLFTKL